MEVVRKMACKAARKTMADWIKKTSEWLETIYKQIYKELLLGDYHQCDETPIRFNDPDEKIQELLKVDFGQLLDRDLTYSLTCGCLVDTQN